MDKRTYPAIFTPFSDNESGYVVVVPDLPGCTTGGDSLAEAMDMAIDAASGWILGELEEGMPVPPPSKIQDIVPEEPGSFVNYISLDIDAYAEKYGSKAVRKNLTIPAYLNTAAEKARINFSEVLKEALEKKLQLA